MSRLLLFLFMCCFAASDSHDTASNYIFAVAICELMVFLIDLYEAYHSVAAAIIPGCKNVAGPYLILLLIQVLPFPLFPPEWPLQSCMRRCTFELHILKGNWKHEGHDDSIHAPCCGAVFTTARKGRTRTRCVIVRLVK